VRNSQISPSLNRRELRLAESEFRKALDSSSEVRITFVGRKSGKKFSTPVWFVREGGTVFLLPVKGTSTNWYQNVLKNPAMELEASGKRTQVAARPIKDKKGIEATVERFRVKYGEGDVKRYYPKTDAAVEISV
jgi:deazaflavin-dependent oxidoreductase (nitroreductase family)